MTKYIFFVHKDEQGYLHTVVTRLSDGLQKYFFQTYGSKEGMIKFLESMTDELVEGYFPNSRKKGTSSADNWAFLGENSGRTITEELARIELTAEHPFVSD